MREMIVRSGSMNLVSDSHTRYGAMGSLSIGEGGPELVKTMLGKDYEMDYPDVIGVLLKNAPQPWIGPMDVALAIIGAVFKKNFVKNKVLEFFGPGISSLSMDFRNGVDTMTTESACLSSIWQTDDKVDEYFRIHGRVSDAKRLCPSDVALYDGVVEIDLAEVKPMIALPFHPSNVYPIEDVIANLAAILDEVEKEAKKIFEHNNIAYDLQSKAEGGKLHVDQGIVAGCAAGSFENLFLMSRMSEYRGMPLREFEMSLYPASQPIYYELNRLGAINVLMRHGAKVKTAFCGPCFGAGDTPANNSLSLRHVTRNFPNREGSDPTKSQVAFVALADARTIAATAFNGGFLTTAEHYAEIFKVPEYHFEATIYQGVVHNSFNRALPEIPIEFGPSIKDWPDMFPLPQHLFLRVASVIRDEVTTTDELIPSGETASYRSDPYRISEYTLIRKDPSYRERAKFIRDIEQSRIAGDIAVCAPIYDLLRTVETSRQIGAFARDTGLGSVLYAKRPGDGSAREYAASCQRVLGGLANVCLEYATKRYRSNCINWGILPFTFEEDPVDLETDDYIYVPNVRSGVENGMQVFPAFVVRRRNCRSIILHMDVLAETERQILLAGSLINFYKNI
jgi:aconitate hydratase